MHAKEKHEHKTLPQVLLASTARSQVDKYFAKVQCGMLYLPMYILYVARLDVKIQSELIFMAATAKLCD